jgi:hypothetical protein
MKKKIIHVAQVMPKCHIKIKCFDNMTDEQKKELAEAFNGFTADSSKIFLVTDSNYEVIPLHTRLKRMRVFRKR